MMGYSLLTTLLRKVSFWLIGVACVVVMGNQWTTFFFIVSSLMPYGVKFAVFGIQWVVPRSVKSFFFIWRNQFGKHLSIIWNMVPACLMCLVWQERNACIFEDKARTLEHLKCLLFRTLFLWARIWGCPHCTAVADFFSFYFLQLLIFLYLFHCSKCSPS